MRAPSVLLIQCVPILSACATVGGPATPTDWPAVAVAGPPVVDARSGRRLQAVFARAANGARKFLHFYDTERKVRCAFAMAEDDVDRCLPEVPDVDTFSDSYCREPLLPAEAACAQAFAVHDSNARRIVHRLGAPVSLDAAYGWSKDENGKSHCVRQKLGAARSFFTKGARVPASSFVALESEGPQRLADAQTVPWLRVASDGAVEQDGLYDTKLGTRCIANTDAEGRFRCLPLAPWVSQTPLVFADVGCAEPFAAPRKVAGPPPRFALQMNTTGCPFRVRVFEAESLALADVHVRTRTGSCVPSRTGAPSRVVAKAPAPPSTFVPMTLAPAAGRIGERRLSTPEGVSDEFPGLWDTQYEEPCDFRATSDGAVRCVPRLAARAFFGDSTCKTPVARPPRSATTCRRAPVLHAVFGSGPWCAPTVKAFTLTAPAKALFVRRIDGTCEPVPLETLPDSAQPDAGAPDRHVPHVVGEPLDLEAFEAGEIVVEK